MDQIRVYPRPCFNSTIKPMRGDGDGPRDAEGNYIAKEPEFDRHLIFSGDDGKRLVARIANPRGTDNGVSCPFQAAGSCYEQIR